MIKAPKALPRLSAAAALVLVPALALTGCTGSAKSSSGTTSSTPLNLANTLNAPSTYNPWGPGYGINYSLWWSAALYDSLVTLNPNGTPKPSLAASWTQNGTNLKLKLRTDVKFTDGTALDAKAVKANMDYAAAHPSGAECNAYLAGMKTTISGSDSVTLTTPKPVPGLLQDLGQCAGFIVNPKALSKDSSLTSTPAGSGPYTLDPGNTAAGQKYTFVRNPKYWNKAAFPYDKVVITQYSTTAAATNAVQSGQADLVEGLVKSDVNGVRSGSNLKVAAGAPNFFQGIWFIDTKGRVSKPLGDVRVRQAMNYAIDRQAIVKSQFGTTGFAVASTPFAKYYEGYNASLNDLYPYDVAKAKQLLTEAGYPHGFSVSIVAGAGGLTQMAEAIAGQLSKIGITMKISTATSNFIAEMQSGKYPMVEAAYSLNTAQYQTIQGIVGPNGFWNPLHNSDPDVAALLGKISTASSADTPALYSQLAKLIAQKALLVCPVVSSLFIVYNPSKIKYSAVPGVGPMLYGISPASK